MNSNLDVFDDPVIKIDRTSKRTFFLSVFIPAVIALAYAGFLANLPVRDFIDRDNYIIYTYISDIVLLRNQNAGLLALLSNEPLWLLLNILLSSALSPDDVIRALIFVSSFLASYTIIRQDRKNIAILILFLIFPLFIKNYIIHLRQGVAISLFIFAFYLRNKPLHFVLMSITPFIHSSFFFVLMIYVISYLSNRINIPTYLKISVLSLFFIVLGLTLTVISSGLGARQANEYIDASIEVSGMAFVFWLVVMTIFLSSGEKFLKNYLFEVSSLSFYLCTYFTIVFSGRIFESAVVTILIAGLSLSARRKHLFILTIIAFMVSDYALRSSQPAFGWGLV